MTSHSSHLQDPGDNTLEPFDLSKFTLDSEVGAVVCGLDTKINYTKLSKAFQFLTRNPGCHFIATNEDSTFPSSAGLLPGAGSISAPLRYALGRDPVCTGKPAGTLLDCVKAKCVSNQSFEFDAILTRSPLECTWIQSVQLWLEIDWIQIFYLVKMGV